MNINTKKATWRKVSTFAAVPKGVPLAIDPSEITESLIVPSVRNIYVRLSETDKINLIRKGLVISFK